MNSFAYILYSSSLDRYYIGSTSILPEERLRFHLKAVYGSKKYTSKAKDWKIFHTINCPDISTAQNIEKHIKQMKSRTYIENLAKYPGMSEKLLIKYSTN